MKLMRSFFRASQRRARRSSVQPIRPTLEALEPRWMPAVSVTSFHYDNASTGVNANETQLTPANVQVGSFGKEFSTSVDGQVYAQPLVVPNVTIAGGPNTRAGSVGTHNVVFVATENDSLYAIDADPADNGAILWQRSFLDPSNPDNALAGATSITPISANDVNIQDIAPVIGITGTPVIDPTTNLLYVVTNTTQTVNGVKHFVQQLHAINLADGTDATQPFLIGDTTGSLATGQFTNNTKLYVYGSGDGSVTDPYNGTGKQVVQFNALTENQRMALSLVNGTVYVSWASHGDNGPYHGWIASWNVSQIQTQGFQLSGVFNDTPNGGGAGIWDGGGQLAFEPDGSAFYTESGNGDQDPMTLNAAGFPIDGDYNESLLKIVADPTTSATNQNINGWGMKVADYFTPYNQPELDQADADFGSGAPVLLPPSAGIPGHPNLLVAAGKTGQIYVVDRDNMGKYDPNNDNVLNSVPDGSGHNTPPVELNGVLSTPAYFNGTLYYVSGYGGTAKAFVINPDGSLSVTSQTTETFGYLPGSVVVSANGTSNGIVWMTDRNSNTLTAYDASSLGNQLWSSNESANGADYLGSAVKFATPVVANGEVFVGTSDSLVVYGLTPPANSVPDAPVLSATAVTATSVRLTWTDATALPNEASGYLIEESTDGGNTFTQVTTAPAGTTSLDLGGLTDNTTYEFRIRGYNGLGDSSYSNIVSVTTSNSGNQPPLAPSGLGGTPASATSINLTWQNNSTNETGFYLDRATDPNFLHNLSTLTLQGSMSSYTDASAGLAAGGTYYYRLRAFNSAGDSANSNTVAVSIPLAPAKPTNAEVTSVSSDEVTLSWTDNAGPGAQGYEILRSANHGGFTVAAMLPAKADSPPSPYTWTDTNVQPDTFYEYHIEAYNVSGHNDFAGTNTTTLPAAPAGLTAVAGSGSITLNWNAVMGAVSYNVYRGTQSGGESATPLVVGVTATSFVDSSGVMGQTYYYYVTAVTADQPPLMSAPSGEGSATISPPPPLVSSPPPSISSPSPGPTSFTSQFNGLFQMLIQPMKPDGAPIGPALAVPFPLDFFFSVQQVTLDSSGNADVVLQFWFLDLILTYNREGSLTGFAF